MEAHSLITSHMGGRIADASSSAESQMWAPNRARIRDPSVRVQTETLEVRGVASRRSEPRRSQSKPEAIEPPSVTPTTPGPADLRAAEDFRQYLGKCAMGQAAAAPLVEGPGADARRSKDSRATLCPVRVSEVSPGALVRAPIQA